MNAAVEELRDSDKSLELGMSIVKQLGQELQASLDHGSRQRNELDLRMIDMEAKASQALGTSRDLKQECFGEVHVVRRDLAEAKRMWTSIEKANAEKMTQLLAAHDAARIATPEPEEPQEPPVTRGELEKEATLCPNHTGTKARSHPLSWIGRSCRKKRIGRILNFAKMPSQIKAPTHIHTFRP